MPGLSDPLQRVAASGIKMLKKGAVTITGDRTAAHSGKRGFFTLVL